MGATTSEKLRIVFLVGSLIFLSVAGHSATAQNMGPIPQAKINSAIDPVPVTRKSDLLFKRLTMSQGLSQTRVSKIAQDTDGYVWFGSQYGISRYDGREFQTFSHDQNDPGSLSGVFIYSLFKDASGVMWAGTDQFLDAYDRTTGKFKHYKIAGGPWILHISQAQEGQLWLSTAQGLFLFDPKTGATKRFGHDITNTRSLSSDDIKSTGVDRLGNFWVASSYGLEIMDPRTGEVTYRIPLRQEVLEFGFYEDSKGVFWIYYGSGNGLAIFDRLTNTVRRLSYDSSAAETSLRGVYSIIETSKGDLLFATMGSGILKLDRSTFSLDQYVNDPNDEQSIVENRAIALLEDKEANVWVGLHAMPPNVFSGSSPTFRKLWPAPKVPNEIGEALVNSIVEDSQGNVWLGAAGKLNRISPEGNVENLTPGGEDQKLEILAINEDKKGFIWVGTLGAGFFSIDPISRKVETYRYKSGTKDGPSSDIVTRFYMGDEGSIWFTTWNGLNRLDLATKTFQHFQRPQPAPGLFFSLAPTADKKGFWIATPNGLLKFLKSTGTFEEFVHKPDDRSSLSNNTVLSIIHDQDGQVWVGTQNGLNRMRPDGTGFDSFFEADGLPGNVVSCILPDTSGDLWMGTNHGVAHLNRRSLDIDTFSDQDGLPGEDLSGWAACSRGPSNTLYFAGFAGAAATRAPKPVREFSLPPVVFTDIKANGKPVVADHGNPSVTLSHDESLEVSFAAITFRDPQRTKYRYLLEGMDTDWRFASRSGTTLNFPYLPGGKFALVVQAGLKKDAWPTTSASLSITVVPAWWEWWPTYVGGALAIAAMAFAYARHRTQQIRASFSLRLDERLAERTRVARELHDTLLQSFQGITFRLQAARDTLFSKPDKAAHILDGVLEQSDKALLEGRNAIHALRDPDAVRVDLGFAINAKGNELSSTDFGDKHTEFSMVRAGNPWPLSPDTQDEILRIASEALLNAFKHAEASKVDCVLEYSSDGLKLSVKDNGTGLGVSPRSTNSWGVKGMRERAERIGATLSVQSLTGVGTMVQLTLPAKRTPPLKWIKLR